MLNIENVVNIFREYSMLSIPISLLLSIIIALVGVVPSIFVTGANIIFFGPTIGFLISLIGETVGAYITFIVYRSGFKKGAENITNKYKLVGRIVESSGNKTALLIFEGRLVPFIPSGFITLAASISNINIKLFTIATLFGKIPSIALESLISYDVINIQENFIRIAITIISLLLILMTIKKINNNN
ncbi:VTT domain-containing protein [Clostridium gasigenes]|uniref:TVP38/TMEM64 family protein n=1 Tax=Clostridium gasigenes TaxID=94869 RepID=UPI001C0D8829|nr:VTT domain-containing protein [Clostridium gasigenes]MBU3133262.1 VTT domain-containing protein [Clostridium gasigenes]